MNPKMISRTVWAEAEPLAAAAGCIVWDVKFIKEGGEWVLKVLLDTEPPGRVDISMCEAVNRGLDARLDELDIIERSYVLEVSSAGLARELYRPGDFDRFAGSRVDIRLFSPDAQGRKSFTAVLAGREDGEILLRDGEDERRLPLSEIALCRLHFEF